MSLYYEAAGVLDNPEQIGGSLKSRIYKKKDLKSPPAQIFALIAEASRWSAVLKDVIEKSELLAKEKKISPILALLLAHDLLVSKRGVAAPANHVLKLAITRHKARLNAEFTKARIRAGHATLKAFREALNKEYGEQSMGIPRHPRWVRVNTLNSSLSEQLITTFADYKEADTLQHVMSASASSKIYFVDPNIPNLLALPPKSDLSSTEAYSEGRIIFQDKASCFPAYLLDVQPGDGDIIDGCAAPGNKTTHLAALVAGRQHEPNNMNTEVKVIAFEKDTFRAGTLKKMVKIAHADQIVHILGGQDFLAAQPHSEEFANVGAILLDPSCSGTGIVGRDDTIKLHLPNARPVARSASSTLAHKKRGRGSREAEGDQSASTLRLDMEETLLEEKPATEDGLGERLKGLSDFQLRILTHAMRFPKARRITYSTCSIHFEENEGVVFRALSSPIAKEQGWRVLGRSEQISGMMNWKTRGGIETRESVDSILLDVEEQAKILEACIRCDKGTADGTMGFFVAAFVRDVPAEDDSNANEHDATYAKDDEDEEEEWNGFFSDDQNTS